VKHFVSYYTEVTKVFYALNRPKVYGIHNEELNDLYSARTIVRVIKSRRIRWAGHVACMGRGEACTGFWWENLRERDRWRDPGVDRRIFRKWDVGGMDWIELAQDRDRCRALVNAVMNLRIP
jgi:hypothetical protein